MSTSVGVAMGAVTKNPAIYTKRYTHREDGRDTEDKLIRKSKRRIIALAIYNRHTVLSPCLTLILFY